MNSSLDPSWVNLAKYWAWPAVALVVVGLYRDSIRRLLETLASRSVKFAALKVRLELGQLTKSPLNAAQLTTLAGQSVSLSYRAQIANSIRVAAGTDYLLVDIGSAGGHDTEKRWLTSRLFILAAILERIRGLRCLVFVTNAGAKSKFICVATPRNVRWSLGIWFPWLEKAFAIAYGSIASEGKPDALFKRGLDDSLIDPLIATFLSPQTGLVEPVDPPNPGTVPVKDNWVELTRKEGDAIVSVSHEHASWIDAAVLTEVLAGRMDQAAVMRTKGPSPERAGTIIGSVGAFVALVDDQMMFEGLYDRSNLLDQISGQVAARMAEELETKPSRPSRR